MKHTIVEGTSEPQDFALFERQDGSDVALNGSTWSIDLEWREDVTGPAVSWISAALGTARVTGLEGLAAGVYHFRFKLAAGDDVAFVPSEVVEAVTLRVIPV